MTLREKAETLAFSSALGVLLFAAIARIVRVALPALVILLVLPAPLAAQSARVQTLAEWSVLGAHALDAASTQRCLGSGRCREANPYLARFDQPVAFTGAKVGLAWVQLWAVRKIRPSHPRLAAVVNFGIAGGFAALAIRNERDGR